MFWFSIPFEDSENPMIIPADAAALAESQSRDGSFGECSSGQLHTISFYRTPNGMPQQNACVVSLESASRQSRERLLRDSGDSSSDPSAEKSPAAIAQEVVLTMERMGLLSSVDSVGSRGVGKRSLSSAQVYQP